MNKNEYWKAVVEKYPKWADEDEVVKLTSRGLQRLIRQAWDEGHATTPTRVGKFSEEMNDLFGVIFGGKS